MLSCFASLHNHLFNLFISHAFTRTKDYSPKRQFQNSSHYGVKLINLSLLTENVSFIKFVFQTLQNKGFVKEFYIFY